MIRNEKKKKIKKRKSFIVSHIFEGFFSFTIFFCFVFATSSFNISINNHNACNTKHKVRKKEKKLVAVKIEEKQL